MYVNPCSLTDVGAVTAGPRGQAFTWWPGLAVAGVGSSLLAAVHRPQQYLRAGAQQREVGEHLDDEHDPGGLGFGAMSPKPTVVNTVTLKYRASVRVSGSVKFAAEARGGLSRRSGFGNGRRAADLGQRLMQIAMMRRVVMARHMRRNRLRIKRLAHAARAAN